MGNKRKRSGSAAQTLAKEHRTGFYPETWHVWIVVGLCACGFLIYANTFSGTFHFDDWAVIVNNPAVRNVWDLGAIFNAFNTRFVPGWTFAVNYALGQLNVTGYHFFNIWLHVCNAVLVYTLAQQLLGLEKGKRRDVHNFWIAVVAAFIFLTHPVQTQAVNYIWQRVTLCAVFFYLGAIVLYIHARVYSPRGYYLSAMVCCFLAMFSKEIAFTLPLMIVLVERIFLRRVCRDQRSWFWTIPFLLMLAVIPLFLQRSSELTLTIMRPEAITRGVSEEVMPRKDYLLTQVNVARTYLRLFVWPIDQSIDYDYPLYSQTGWRVWTASLMFLLVVFASGIFFVRTHPLIGFGIFWFFLTITVESVVTSADVLAEHRMYLAMAGLSLACAFCAYQWGFRRHIYSATVLVVIAVLALGGMSVKRNMVWQNDLELWNDAIRKFPNKARSFNNRGVMFKGMNSFDMALRDFNRAIELDPKLPQAFYNRGGIFRMSGEYDRALEDYARVIELEPKNPKAYDALGSIYRRKGMLDEALEKFTASLAIDPRNPEVYNNRAHIYQKQGRDDLALEDYTRAIYFDPGYVYAYNNRGNLYLKMGNPKAALQDYDRAIRLQPQFAEAYLNRAIAKFDLDLFDESRADLEIAQAMGLTPKPEFVRQLKEALEK